MYTFFEVINVFPFSLSLLHSFWPFFYQCFHHPHHHHNHRIEEEEKKVKKDADYDDNR